MPAFPTPAGLSPALIARRIAMPLLIFAAVLTALLTLSWYLVLPRYTAFAVDGKMIAASALPDYEREVQDDIARSAARREELALPTQDATYLAAVTDRADDASLRAERDFLDATIAKIDAMETVEVTALRVRADGAVQASGDVHGAGLGSMTLLARFVDAVAADDGVTDLQPPAFTREQDPERGPHSPFTFTYRRAAPAR
jgi:hypothetical protein